MKSAKAEIHAGERFAFGNNWKQFLSLLDEARVNDAMASLQEMISRESLVGMKFLDIGSGSGLFSLAARLLGAEVVSFDYDPESVACTAELRARFFPQDPSWEVFEGSALDRDFLGNLGQFNIVYSWGVLHHTGDMWSALENVVDLVRPGGQLFISIYNDQGRASRNWRWVKQTYNSSGPLMRKLLIAASSAYLQRWTPARRLYRTFRGAPKEVPSRRARGMDRRRDMVDWVGGWPFEVAKPEEIFRFYAQRGFHLDRLVTCGGGLGCNQFVFSRLP